MYIVEMNEKNLSDAAECICKSWTFAHLKYFSLDYINVYVPERIAAILKKDDSTDKITFLAYDKNMAIGVVTIDKIKCEIPNLYVDPDRLRQGVGSKLMEFAVKQMTSINRIFVTVLSVNEIGLAFFEKHGFEFTGEQRTLKNGMLELRYVYKKKK